MEYTLIIILILVVIYLIHLSMKIRVDKLEGRMKVMQYTLDQLARHSEIPENPINDDLRKLINVGEDIKAVKKARETLGLSLLEGKEYIDKLKLDNSVE